MQQRQKMFAAGLVLLTSLSFALTSHANPVVMEDWTQEVGLSELEGPSYTAGWLDIDLDGDDEPIWVCNEAVYYLNHNEEGLVVLESATIDALSDPPLYAQAAGQASLASGDFDRDGTIDLLIIEKVARLYRVAEPGHLVEMNVHIPWLPLGPVSFDAAVGDLNADGWPDVAIAQARTATEHFYQRGAIDIILMNRGGHFERLPIEPIIRKQSGAIAMADMDQDGRLDIVESVTFSRTTGLARILLNRTESGADIPTFETAEHTFDQGAMGMGVAIEDINQDGFLDLFHSSTGNDFLVYGNADGTFTDKTWETKVDHEWASEGGPRVQWAPTIIDMNADGRLDLYQRHGHVQAGNSIASSFDFKAAAEPNLIYAQQEDGTFERMSVPLNPDSVYNGNDSAMGDFDGDGLPELTTGGMYNEEGTISTGLPVFWHNASEKNPAGRALSVRLAPTVSANPPTGARVKATCGDQTWTRTLSAGGHVASLASAQLLFAWSTCKEEVDLEVHWPTGAIGKFVVAPNETRFDVYEPQWSSLGDDEQGGLQVTLDSREAGHGEACYRPGSESAWVCCSVDEAPCVYPYAPETGDFGLVKIGDYAVPKALQPLGGWHTLRVNPTLPKPNEKLSLELFHGGLPASFGITDTWLRLDDKKVVFDVDEIARIQTVEVDGRAMGEDMDFTFFEGVKTQRVISIPNGYALDQRWLEDSVYPNQNLHSERPWRLYLTPKPHHPNKELVKIDHINVRTHPEGAMLAALVTRDHTGRIRIDVEWDLLPADQGVTIFEDDVLRAGPYPVKHLPDSSSIEARLDYAEGLFSRVFIVEGGDIARFIFTCYDEDGNVMPQPGDLLEAELDGLEIYEDFSIPTIYGGGWETSLLVRSKPGTGPASLTLRMKSGKKLGRWELTRRAAKDVAVSAELTTVQIKQSTLPAGVDAQTTLQIFARSDLGELLGKDADVRVEAPPELRVGPALVNEAGIYESIVEPGYYGGQYEISVFLGDELLEKVPFEVIGPALPEKPASTVSWPNEEPSDVNSQVEPPPSQAPQGCNTQSGTGPSAWPLALLLLMWIYARPRQRESIRQERSR